MKVIKRINILSVAKIAGILYGGIYLIVGLIINIAVLALGIPSLKSFDLLGFGSGALATFLLALLIGAVSFVLGAIFAWLYNIAAKIVGGIKWDEDMVADNYGLPKIKKDERKGAPRRGSGQAKDAKAQKEELPKLQEEVNNLLDQTKKEESRETFPSDSNDNPNFLSS